MFNLSATPLIARIICFILIPSLTAIFAFALGWDLGAEIYTYTIKNHKLTRHLDTYSPHFLSVGNNLSSIAALYNLGIGTLIVIAWNASEVDTLYAFLLDCLICLFAFVAPCFVTHLIYTTAAILRHHHIIKHRQHAIILSRTLLRASPTDPFYTPLDYARSVQLSNLKFEQNLQNLRRAHDTIEARRTNCCLRLDEFADRRDPEHPEQTPISLYDEILDSLAEEFAAERTRKDEIATLEAENQNLISTIEHDTAILNTFLMNVPGFSHYTACDIVSLCDPDF